MTQPCHIHSVPPGSHKNFCSSRTHHRKGCRTSLTTTASVLANLERWPQLSRRNDPHGSGHDQRRRGANTEENRSALIAVHRCDLRFRVRVGRVGTVSAVHEHRVFNLTASEGSLPRRTFPVVAGDAVSGGERGTVLRVSLRGETGSPTTRLYGGWILFVEILLTTKFSIGQQIIQPKGK